MILKLEDYGNREFAAMISQLRSHLPSGIRAIDDLSPSPRVSIVYHFGHKRRNIYLLNRAYIRMHTAAWCRRRSSAFAFHRRDIDS